MYGYLVEGKIDMTSYEGLLAQAQANPHDADFHALRMAYTRSDHYAPYMQDGESIQALHAALQAQNMEAALEAIGRLLAFNYLDIEAHMAADYVHIQLEDHAQSAYHRAFAKGLIDAILVTGTGRDFDSAFIVISVAEEYLVLRVIGLIPGNQQLVQHEGHWFDVLTARHPQTNEAMDIYFNIDLPRGWQEDHLS
jgi:hypothetical protein